MILLVWNLAEYECGILLYFLLTSHMQHSTPEISRATDFLGKIVLARISRPIGSKHPRYDLTYQVNYGYVPNTLSPDNEELDVYVLGVSKPIADFNGRCVAVIHRTDDADDKLVLVPQNARTPTDDEIREATDFQERFFTSEIIRANGYIGT